jgi:UDPglucose--hexose-1-phosphate uridylyltransferase
MTPREVLALRDRDAATDPNAWRVRSIPNQFAVLRIEGKVEKSGEGPYDRMNGIGAHEVIIESRDHDASLEDYTPEHLRDILWIFRERTRDLLKDPRFRYTLIFRNFGESVGVTDSHPHSQVIALPVLPRVVREELAHSFEYWNVKERCLFCDMIDQDRRSNRVVYQNKSFVALEPFAAKFPFETWIYPVDHASAFHQAPDELLPDLADAILTTVRAFVTATPETPYHIIFHSAPDTPEKSYHTRQAPVEQHYHWHIEIMPRGNRVAGFEYGTGTFINSVLPEDAAEYMRNVIAEQQAAAGS